MRPGALPARWSPRRGRSRHRYVGAGGVRRARRRMSERDGTSRLRIGVDVRCLGGGELRGFARYTLELIHALSARPALDVVALSDAEVGFDLPVPVRHFGGRRELVREQVALTRTAARERLDLLLAP